MPIYEYQSFKSQNGCNQCLKGFEIFQGIHEDPLSTCPFCGNKIKKVISWCRSAISETPQEQRFVENRVKEYEKAGLWSHAAELADKHSDKTKDKNLQMRALDNYQKAGYNSDSLAKHIK
ncbi:MAG: zinc ribbon domain-containing protein [Deltaproteobacteria bacterium]|nr:zinc ribbon domain-containing protein [Deltaproteobacteria bacterium]